MISDLVLQTAKDKFLRMSPYKSNQTEIQHTVAIEKLRKQVVARLQIIERGDDGKYWWLDKVMIRMFDELYNSGIILLPSDPIDRMRWIALVCIAISQVEGFASENVVLPADYVPDEELADQDVIFGTEVVEAVQLFRRKLAKEGWKSLL